jgi:hypothetical protein
MKGRVCRGREAVNCAAREIASVEVGGRIGENRTIIIDVDSVQTWKRSFLSCGFE